MLNQLMTFHFRISYAEYASEKLEQIHAQVDKKLVSQFGALPEKKSEKLVKDHDSMLANLKRIYKAEKDRLISLPK